MHKSAALLLVLTLALPSLSMVNPVSSEITKPSTPQFTVKFENGTTYQPAIYSIDPYTGRNVTISPVKYGQWADILLTMTNQPFTPYQNSNGTWIQLYYCIDEKGHFSDNWQAVAPLGDDPSNNGYAPQRTNYNSTGAEFMGYNFEPNSKVDFRVQAMIGYFKDSNIYTTARPAQVFVGQTSDWSATQTVTIPYNITSNSSDISATPSGSSPNSPIATAALQQPNAQTGVLVGLGGVEIAILVLVVVVVVLVIATFFHRKKTQNTQIITFNHQELSETT